MRVNRSKGLVIISMQKKVFKGICLLIDVNKQMDRISNYIYAKKIKYEGITVFSYI